VNGGEMKIDEKSVLRLLKDAKRYHDAVPEDVDAYNKHLKRLDMAIELLEEETHVWRCDYCGEEAEELTQMVSWPSTPRNEGKAPMVCSKCLGGNDGAMQAE
jgi:rubrerythrin